MKLPFNLEELWIKKTYHLIYKNDKEELYCNNIDKIVFFVKDSVVGKRLAKVIPEITKAQIDFYYQDRRYIFGEYDSNRQSGIQWFSLKLIGTIFQSTKIRYLNNIQSFTNQMATQGFYLDDTIFDVTKCEYITEFLSYYAKSNAIDKEKRSAKCMIEYIHYRFTNGGSTIKDFYSNGLFNLLYDVDRIPYPLSIAKLCYDYCKKGEIPLNIESILVYAEQEKQYFDRNSMILFENIQESGLKVIEENEKFTLYDGNIKIYKNVSGTSLEDILDESAVIEQTKTDCFETILKVIRNFNFEIIGYLYETKKDENVQSILNVDFNTQSEIVLYVDQLNSYFYDYYKQYGNIYRENIDSFEVEKFLVYKCDTVGFSKNNFVFKAKTIDAFIKVISADISSYQKKITKVFFILLAKYLYKKYGVLEQKNEIKEKMEVRVLGPKLSEYFANFILKEKSFDEWFATIAFYEFLENCKLCSNTDFYFDANLGYDPFVTPILYEYEVEKKYGVKFERNTSTTLPDGREIIYFPRLRTLSVFYGKDKLRREDIERRIGNIEDDYVSLLGVSEVIVSSQALSQEKTMFGYITKSKKGKQLNFEEIKKLNNRDLLKATGRLFCKFKTFYIRWKNIWMDENFNFYIDYLRDGFELLETKKGHVIDFNSDFVKWLFEELIRNGYPPAAFIGWTLPERNYRVDLGAYLITLANSLDTYCDEHKIYYNSTLDRCPVCTKIIYNVEQNYESKYQKVWEDEISTHYRLNNAYALKVYKVDSEKLAAIEANVEYILNNNLLDSLKLNLFQDCFIPYRKAIDSNKKFIGYVYNTVKFESTNGKFDDVCIDLKEKLRNLPRLKSLIRLLYQVKNLTEQNMGFIDNPFSYVFLNKGYKKQVQILNIDFICIASKEQIKQSRNWAYEYVCSVLKDDETLQVEKIANKNDLNNLLIGLEKLAEELNKYCPVHRMFYNRSHLCCPKCIPPNESDQYIKKVSVGRYNFNNPINEGGESYIYSYATGEKKRVLKVFKKDQINSDFKSQILLRIISKQNILNNINQRNLKYHYIIPQKIFVDEKTNELFGYVMDKVENGYPISTLRDKTEVNKLGLSKNDLFEILITIGEGIETLHNEANIFIGDLNGRNILFDKQKNVYFLDFDGMGVDEISPEFCTDGYIDPVSKKNQCITQKDDWYSFAVQAFYYLTYTHPFNGIYYEIGNGKRQLLDIPDKMERKISLLGNHGMKPPEIALPWDWFNDNLKKAFLDTFEGNYRESIVPFLKEQYEMIQKHLPQRASGNIYRINSKFYATEITPFEGNVVKVFSPNIAICEINNVEYVSFIVKEGNSNKQINIRSIVDIKNIVDIKLSEDESLAFVLYRNNKYIAFDLQLESVIGYEYFSDSNLIVNDNTLYYYAPSQDNYYIFKREFTSNGEIVRSSINTGAERIKYLDVRNNSKFIMIKEAEGMSDVVYCNSEKFCEINYSGMQKNYAKYYIAYDEVKKSWIIVNDFGKAILIQSNGDKKELDLKSYVNQENYDNIKLENDNIYIPIDNGLTIYNVNSQIAKTLECSQIMNSTSKIYEINAEGFCFMNQKTFYKVCKG